MNQLWYIFKLYYTLLSDHKIEANWYCMLTIIYWRVLLYFSKNIVYALKVLRNNKFLTSNKKHKTLWFGKRFTQTFQTIASQNDKNGIPRKLNLFVERYLLTNIITILNLS